MSFSINHIFFPTDFSNNAKRALPFAAEIALKADAKLTLFHASQIKMDLAPNFEKAKEQFDEESSKQFDKLISSLNDGRYSSLSISSVTKDGQAVPAILNQVTEQEADLIVMGTKGATADRNTIFGSVTSRVIQKSPVPVLTIPGDSRLDNFNNIIFTTDFKKGDPKALEETTSFAQLFDATVDLLHVSDQKNIEREIRFRGFRELIQEQVSYDLLDFHHQYDLDLFPAVGEFIDEHPNSVLVMVRYKKNFWDKLAKRNHSKEMAFYSKVPLLVLPAELDTEIGSIFEDS